MGMFPDKPYTKRNVLYDYHDTGGMSIKRLCEQNMRVPESHVAGIVFWLYPFPFEHPRKDIPGRIV